MGITLFQADIMIQEHKRKPLPETVHLLGRQTVRFTLEEAQGLFKRHGIKPCEVVVEYDKETLGALDSTQAFINDATFFRMFGVKQILAIDHSDYEGAEIIVDLNKPLTENFKSIADFIYGGSVLDNIFDPANYLRNLTQLLKVGGRLVDHNTCSFRDHPYVAISPAWYFDYCVLNRFARCDLYVSETGTAFCSAPPQVYVLDIASDQKLVPDFGNPTGGLAGYVTVIAEKGADTSHDATPSQDQYRSEEEFARWKAQIARMKASFSPIRFSRPDMPPSAYALRNVRGLRYLGCFDPMLPLSDPPPMSIFYNEENPTGIRVVEATYGWNHRNTEFDRMGLLSVHRGNVTNIFAYMLNGRNGGECMIDVNVIRDSAPGHAKDFSLLYYYAEDPDMRLQRIYIPEEAHGEMVLIPPYAAPRQSNDTSLINKLTQRLRA